MLREWEEKRKQERTGKWRHLGGKLSYQMQSGWHVGWREEGPKVTREKGRHELQGYLAVQAGHWGSPANEPVSRRVKRDSLVLSWLPGELSGF